MSEASSSSSDQPKWPHTLRVKVGSLGVPPNYQTEKSAGLDLYCSKEITIPNGKRAWVDTEVSMALPPGTSGEIYSRSSLAGWGLDVGAGLIDEDFRGKLRVLMINNGIEPYTIKLNQRFAQMVVREYVRVNVVELGEDEQLDPTKRGEGGFGHTGTGV